MDFALFFHLLHLTFSMAQSRLGYNIEYCRHVKGDILSDVKLNCYGNLT